MANASELNNTRNSFFVNMSRTISRGMSSNDHLSRAAVTNSFKRPTWKRNGQLHCFLFGLASDGVYMCPLCYQRGGSPLHYPSNLTTKGNLSLRCLRHLVAVHFCCTGLGVTSTGRYPASCPVKPGLSSPATFRSGSRDHLSYSYFYDVVGKRYFAPYDTQDCPLAGQSIHALVQRIISN